MFRRQRTYNRGRMRRVRGYACLCAVLTSMVLLNYFRSSSPPSTVSIFIEPALRLGKNEIRLLTIHPGKRDKAVQCDLNVVQFEEALPYEALSYTWGDPAMTAPILIRGTSFNITANLHSALLHLRHEVLPRTLWIDAICINQQDLAELGDHVQRMRLIYQTASRVLVWLGEASHDSGLAMELVARIGAARAAQNQIDAREDISYFEDDLPDNKTRRAALNALFRRPYWERLWVLQEFAVAAAPPLLGCGDRWISSSHLDDFAREVYGLYDYNIERILEGDSFESLDNLLRLRDRDPTYLTKLLWSTRRTSKATRPHDHVYALLGLVNKEASDAILVDYEKHEIQLFKEVAAFCLETDRNLDVLYAAPERHQLELPSWVPDWTINQTYFSVFEGPDRDDYHAAPKSESSLVVSKDLTVLNAEGYEVDTIIEADYNSSELRIWDLQQEAARIGSLLVGWAQKHFIHDSPVDVRASWDSNLLEDVQSTLGHCQTVAPKFQKYDPRLRGLLEVWAEDPQAYHDRPYRARAKLLDDVEGELRSFIEDFDLGMFSALLDRRLFVTRSGMIGLGTEVLQVGDIVVVLSGGSVPFVLRKADRDDASYKLVGDAFVLEFMSRENLGGARPRPGNLSRKWFPII